MKPTKVFPNDTHFQNDVVDLQIKIAYLEQHIDMLNEIVAKQDRKIMDMYDLLKILYQSTDKSQIEAFNAQNERPPHY